MYYADPNEQTGASRLAYLGQTEDCEAIAQKAEIDAVAAAMEKNEAVPGMVIGPIRLLEKTGGKSGSYAAAG